VGSVCHNRTPTMRGLYHGRSIYVSRRDRGSLCRREMMEEEEDERGVMTEPSDEEMRQTEEEGRNKRVRQRRLGRNVCVVA